MVKKQIGLFESRGAGIARTDFFLPKTTQVMVKDEVIFAPAMDPYLALQRAVDRLNAGKSIFMIDAEQEQKKSVKDGGLLSSV